MAHIHAIQVGNTEYLIEPWTLIETSGSSSAYTATIDNYEEFENAIFLLRVHANNTGAATLRINNLPPALLTYHGNALLNDQLQSGSTYIINFQGSSWEILTNLAEIGVDDDGGLTIINGALSIKPGGIITTMIADDAITNNKLENSTITIENDNTSLDVSLGSTVTRQALLNILELASVMRFKGVATNNTLAETSTKDPFDTQHTPVQEYTGEAGDVVFDRNQLREYIWTGDEWMMLGINLDIAIDSNNIIASTNTTNVLISRIVQAADGRITNIERTTINTSGAWEGNATTATTLETPRKMYVDLTLSHDENNPVQFDGSSDVTLHVDNILPILHGGLGNNILTTTGVLYTTEDNNSHQYIASGTAATRPYQILTWHPGNLNDVTGYPLWAPAASIESHIGALDSTALTILELGKGYLAGEASLSYSEGLINLFSSGGESHIIRTKATAIEYTHYLPNVTGYLVSTSNEDGVVGSNTQPIYLSTNGVATAITYTPEYIYYPSDTSTFEASSHYITDTKLFINGTPGANEQSITDTFRVYGSSLFTNTILIEEAASLEVITEHNNTYLSFYPISDSTGYLGTINNRWKDLYLSNSITIGIGFFANYSGELTLIGAPSSITLETSASNQSSWIIKNNNGNLYIMNDLVSNTPILQGTNNGFELDSRLFINSSGIPINSSLDLYVHGKTELLGRVGIGTLPDSANTGDQHLLTINGSVQFLNNDTQAAHIDVITTRQGVNLYDTVVFSPTIDATGNIGLIDNRWREGYFSTLFSVGENDSQGIANGILLDANGTLTVITSTLGDTSYIVLSTAEEASTSTGSITITTTIPTISLITTSDNEEAWTFTNTTGNLLITNDAAFEVSLYGTDNGWEFSGQVGIGTPPESWPTNSTQDSHILTINGSTEIISDITSIAHLDVSPSLQFYPSSDATGSIGLISNRWTDLYLYHAIDITATSSGTSSFILLEVEHSDVQGGTKSSTITMQSVVPTISLLSIGNTEVHNPSSWDIYNNLGIFTIADNGTTILNGYTDGFTIAPRLYINDLIPQNPDYTLDVNGEMGIEGNIVPLTTNTYTLGLSNESLGYHQRWKAVYIGTEDTYGDPFTPIYWNGGVPTTIYIVQKISWELTNGKSSVTITPASAANVIFTPDSIVTSIIVTEGESNLNAKLSWSSNNSNQLIISTPTAVSGTVKGYVLVSRGHEYSANDFSYSQA